MQHRAKGFREWINESTEPAFMTHLKKMRRSGLIDQDTYLKKVLKFSQEEGMDPTGLLEPGEALFDPPLDAGSEEEEEQAALLNEIGDLAKNFRGPRGEFAVMVKREVFQNSMFYDFTITLSDGSQFKWSYTSFYDPGTLNLEKGGQVYELDPVDRDNFENDVATDFSLEESLTWVIWSLLEMSYES